MTPQTTDKSYGQTVQDCPLKNKPRTWIAIQLIGEDDRPVPSIAYKVLLPDGTTREGALDGDGSARVDGIDPGSCVVTFPDLDKDAWTAA